MQVPVVVNRASSFEEIRRNLTKMLASNASDCKYITFGCSFTHGKRVDESVVWMNMLKSAKNVDFINAARCSAGLFQLVDNELAILPTILSTSQVTHVIVQRPLCLRYYWNSSKKKYNRKRAMYDFIALKPKLQVQVLKEINKAELTMLGQFVGTFPNAKFALWRYWIDDHVQPTIADASRIVQEEASKQLGFHNWGVIVEEHISNFVLNKDSYGCRTHNQPHLFKLGWVAQKDDTHPGIEHNRIVTRRVAQWLGISD